MIRILRKIRKNIKNIFEKFAAKIWKLKLIFAEKLKLKKIFETKFDKKKSLKKNYEKFFEKIFGRKKFCKKKCKKKICFFLKKK